MAKSLPFPRRISREQVGEAHSQPARILGLQADHVLLLTGVRTEIVELLRWGAGDELAIHDVAVHFAGKLQRRGSAAAVIAWLGTGETTATARADVNPFVVPEGDVRLLLGRDHEFPAHGLRWVPGSTGSMFTLSGAEASELVNAAKVARRSSWQTR